MSWANYHTHSYFDDGEKSPREYVNQALKQGTWALGFSGHAPLPWPNDWTMKPSQLSKYCKSIRSLQSEKSDHLQILLGLEIDYIPGVIKPDDRDFKNLGLDFIIGSVHHVGSFGDGKYWPVDASEELFSRGLQQIYKGDIQKAVGNYYRLVRQMVIESPPDIIGHLDLIKKSNQKDKYFSEDQAWYREAVVDTLEAIAQSGAILEVNTGGLTRGKTDSLYPSRWILKRSLDLGIPITLSSDAHSPPDLTAGFEEAAWALKEIGFEELYILGSPSWQPISFSPEGLLLD